MTDNKNVILDVDNLLNSRYDDDTLLSLYQIWSKLPPCELLGVIGGVIQDLQFYKQFYDEHQCQELER